MDDDLPILEPIEVRPAFSDAEMRRLLRLDSTNPEMRAVEAECRAGDALRASVSVKGLLQTGTPLQDLQVCLLRATESGNEHLVQELVSLGVPVNLHVVKAAIIQASTTLLSLFLRHGWEINQEEEWCLPPLLSYAIAIHAPDSVISWFLSNGADPNAVCQMDSTPLSIAVTEAPYPVVKRLFAHCPRTTVFRGQLLHWAAARQTPDDCDAVLRLVLDRCRPDINSIMHGDHVFAYHVRKVIGLGTPLHEAARSGQLSAAQTLIDHGADVTLRDSNGNTPLERAELQGNHDVAELLRSQALKI